MSVERWLGCLALVLVTRAAHADPAGVSAGVDARLDGCQGLPARSRMARSEPVGEDAVHAVARSGDRYLVFPQRPEGCEVYALGRAAARADGRFGVGGKAIAVRAARCGGGSCPVAVAIRGKDDRPLLALRTDLDCDVSVELRPIKLFADRDSLELVCHNSAGAGWTERRVLLGADEDTLVTLYSLVTGSYIAPTPAEKKAGGCAACPVGSIRVEKVGDKPLLRVVDPASGTLQDGKGTLPARQLGYDAKGLTFTPTGAPDVPTAVDARAACRRR